MIGAYTQTIKTQLCNIHFKFTNLWSCCQGLSKRRWNVLQKLDDIKLWMNQVMVPPEICNNSQTIGEGDKLLVYKQISRFLRVSYLLQ